MNIAIIFFSMLLVPSVYGIFSYIKYNNAKANSKMTNRNFRVYVPTIALTIGILNILICLMLPTLFTLFQGVQHWLLYALFGIMSIPALYLILKSTRFKVIVEGEKITVHSILRRPYTFTFNEIVSAVRKVKKNQIKSEYIIIKTTLGRKLTVESVFTGYKIFKKRIESDVDKKYLTGFELKN